MSLRTTLLGAAAMAAIGLLLSFFVQPTLFECKLFTACHQSNVGYALVSLFSPEIKGSLSSEALAVGIAHSLSFTVIGAIAGVVAGFIASGGFSRERFAAVAQPSVSSDLTAFAPREVRPTRTAAGAIELMGLGDVSESYLKVEAAELADMPRGLTIGREAADEGFPIGHETVSRRHASLSVRGGTFVVEDLGSTNGTELNGRRLPQGEAARLRSGDRLTIGSAMFSVSIDPT